MQSEQDIRWKQRFEHYTMALAQFRKFIDKQQLNELEEQGLIKSFEYTYELGWNTLKDYLMYQGYTDVRGSRDAIRTSFRIGLIEDGEGWMDMFQNRNRTSHTYNEKIAREILDAIRDKYAGLFEDLYSKMQSLD